MQKISVKKISSLDDKLNAQDPEEIVFRRPSNPGELPRVNGVNIMQRSSTLSEMTSRLQDAGIEVLRVLYAYFPEGTRIIFLYCMTMHGQYMLVEPPLGTAVDYGDIELNQQRVEVLQSNIQE